MKRINRNMQRPLRTKKMPTGREADFLKVFEDLERGLVAQGIELAPRLRDIAERLGVNSQRAGALARSLKKKGHLVKQAGRHRSYSVVR